MRPFIIDASERCNLSALVNHGCGSRANMDCVEAYDKSGYPRIILIANRDIHEGEELLWSYNILDFCSGTSGAIMHFVSNICYCENFKCNLF